MLEFGEVFGAEELIDLVEENPERSAYGRFVDLSNDLGAFVDNYKHNK